MTDVSGSPSTEQPAPPAGAPKPRPNIVRKILLYGASRGTMEALLAARGLALATILGPEAFGAWALFRLAGRYAGLFALGVHRGVEYEVVHSRRPEGMDNARAEQYSSAALSYVLFTFGSLALVALLGSLVVADARLAMSMRYFAVGIVVEQLWLYSVVNLRARGDLRRFAINEVLNGFLHLVLSVGLAVAFALQGAYAAYLVASIVSVTLITRRVPMRPQWNTERLRRLLRIGVPMAMVLVSGLILTTVDRFVVAAYGGTALLGLYAFAVAIASVATTAAWVVRTVIFPGVYERAAGAGARVAIEEHVRRTVFPFATLFPPLLGLTAIAMGPVIMLLVPQYADAVMPARIFIFTGVAAGLASLTSVGVVAADRQRLLPPFSIAGVVLNIILSTLALRFGLGLPGVAAAALTSQTLFAAAAMSIMAHAGEQPHIARLVARALLPMAWSTVVMSVLIWLLPMMTASNAVLGAALFAGLHVPFAREYLRLGRKVKL